MIIMRSRLSLATAILMIGIGLAEPAWAEHFFFSTGNPDGRLGALSRRPSPGKIETETADDFALTETTVISQAVITGLIVPNTMPLASISQVEVELYHVFPLDSDLSRTIHVPTRVNSPADVEIDTATRDPLARTLSFSSTLLNPSFTVANSVVNGINASPNQLTHGEGPQSGEEVAITINFTTPIILPAGHYFFRPEVLVNGGDFLYLSAPRPIVPPGTPFPAGVTDLQAWIRNANLNPDWLRIGTDIIGIIPPATTAPTFNMTFSLAGDTVPEAGTPGQANCHGKTISALARQFRGINAAVLALGASSVNDLQDSVGRFCNP
ncbi:MAG: PEP-CTERM sorting domain-containing protein [Acidobacteria bacterium]|nr:MAG: PEP-CTERM sorting domain-containing protein [Acidobacteriota bacterium]PYR86734.1 MAG: PEP-CTERM sorting domain-containing protein [Acidobacteriota bacterium]